MRLNNIVTKLWVIMTILVLVVIGIAGAAQTSFMEGLYYEQQARQLVSLGNKVANIATAEKDPKELDDKVALIAGLYNANVMVLDEKGIVRHCQGMGMSTKDMPMDMNNPHHGPLSQHDLEQLYSGKVVVHRGTNEFFNTDVLSVAIPITATNAESKAVIIHAPLKPFADELYQLQRIIIYTAVGGIILATLLSLFFSQMLSKPLVKMNKIALEMANGNYTNRVDIQSNDEIGLLASSLNRLSSQLQEKIRQLEAQEQIRREFVTNVAHEIKTPLTIMQGFTETMVDGLVKDEQERNSYLHHILDEITRLKRLVDDVLNLKRMEEGHFDFDKEPCDFNHIIEKVVHKFSQLIEERRIHFKVTVEKELPKVTCNSDRMEQVLINLMDNAIRHTPEGGTITLDVKKGAHQLHIQVSDTGAGIPSDDLPMIWERFYKADKSRTRGKGGTGLGLAIVKKIIEAHGGEIKVQSSLNQGTSFSILLPISQACVL